MNDLRAHPHWPDLVELGRLSRRARLAVLEAWPEDTSPAELPPDASLRLELAETAARDADGRYRDLLARIQADLTG